MIYSDWLKQWLDDYVKPTTKIRTYNRYKEIVEQHGGAVKAEGVVDQGSTFTVSIPLYNEESERASRRRARSESRKIESSFDEAWEEDGI